MTEVLFREPEADEQLLFKTNTGGFRATRGILYCSHPVWKQKGPSIRFLEIHNGELPSLSPESREASAHVTSSVQRVVNMDQKEVGASYRATCSAPIEMSIFRI